MALKVTKVIFAKKNESLEMRLRTIQSSPNYANNVKDDVIMNYDSE